MVAIVSGNGFGVVTGSAGVLGQSGVFGNPNLGNTREAAYVNIATGNLVLRDQDDFVAALGADISLTRTYNSLGGLGAGTAAGWRNGLVKQVAGLTGTVNTAGSTITRIDGDGSAALYRYDTALSVYVSTDGGGGYDHLGMNAAQEWVWTSDRQDKAGIHEVYATLAAGGNIKSVNDQGGVRLTYRYDAQNRVSQVLDASGDAMFFVYNSNGYLSQVGVGAPGGTSSKIYYFYDSLNRLTMVQNDLTPDKIGTTDGDNYITQYTYRDTSSQIASIWQQDGTKLTFGYTQVGTDWKVSSVTDGANQITRYDYGVAGQTAVTDPLGNRTVYAYDGAGQLVTVTAPGVGNVAAHITRYGYDSLGNVKSVTDPRGLVTNYSYDANGNRVLETGPNGDVVTRAYDLVSNRLLSETRWPNGAPTAAQPSPLALTTGYAYDSGNRLRFTVTPEGRVQEVIYNSNGLRASVIDYAGALLPAGTVPSEAAIAAWAASLPVASSTINRTDYGYDSRGLVTKTSTYVMTRAPQVPFMPGTLPAAFASTGNNITFITKNQTAATYTPLPDWAYQPLGTTFRFDMTTPATLTKNMAVFGVDGSSQGQRFRLMLNNGNINLQSGNTQKYEYPWVISTKANTTYAVEITTDVSGKAVLRVYDKSAGPAGAATATFNFLPGTQVRLAGNTESGTSVGGPTLGDVNRADVTNIVTQAASGIIGNITTARYVYDLRGQLLQTIDGNDKTTATYTYDGLGRQLTAMDSLGNTSVTVYNAGTRSVQLTQANGLLTKSTLDANGRVVSTSQSDAAGNVLSVATNSYDKDGRLRLNVVNGLGTYLLYDKLDRRIASIDANGNLTAYHYNADNQVTRTVAYDQRVNTAQLRDSGGEWRELGLGDLGLNGLNSRSAWNVYDKSGRLSVAIDATGSVTRYVYDGAARLLQVIKRATAVDVAPLATTFAMETFNDTASVDDQISRNYYNKDGLLQVQVDGAGYLTEHLYDSLGQRTASIRHANALPQTLLNDSPTLTTLVAASGAAASRERFFYNIKNQLAATLDNNNFLTSLTYDANGNVASRRRHAAAVTAPAAATLASLGATANDAVDLLTSYTYTTRGELETETTAGIVTRYTYDKAGKLLEKRVGLGSAIERAQSQRYDARGNLIAELNAEGSAALAAAGADAASIEAVWARYATDYTYNANGLRLGATDPNGNKTRYYYDAVGNLTHSVNALGEVTAIVYNGFRQVLSKTSLAARVPAATLATLNGGQNDGAATNAINALRNATLDSTQSFEYDGDGQQTASIDALGYRSTVHYDTFGYADITERQGVNTGNVSAPASNPGGRSFYDLDGRLSAALTSAGLLTVYTYDALDRLTDRVTYAKPVAFATAAADIRKLIADPAAQRDIARDLRQRFFYDGLVTTIMTTKDTTGTDANWSVVKNTHDGLGNLINSTAYAATVKTPTTLPAAASYPPAGAADNITLYAYDSANRLAATATAQNVPDPKAPTMRNWSVTRTFYDAIGNVSATIAYKTALSAVAPTAAELRAYAKDADNSVATAYTYDSANRVKTVATSQGGAAGAMRWAVTSNSYDDAGNLLSSTRHALLQTTAGMLAFPATAPEADAVNDRTTRYRYDAANRLRLSIDAVGAVTRVDYDSRGNVTQRVVYGTLLTAAQLAALPPLADDITKTLGNDALDAKQTFEYDGSGRQTASVDALGYRSTVHYDAFGRADVTERQSVKGANVAAPASNPGGRSFYDLDGRLSASLTSAGVLTVYSYNTLSQLTDRVTYAKPVSYAIAAADLKKMIADPSAQRDTAHDLHQRFFYDGLVTTVMTAKDTTGTDVNWSVVKSTYDALGNLLGRTAYARTASTADTMPTAAKYPETSDADNVVLYAYDGANRLVATATSQNVPDPLAPTKRNWAVARTVYDALGNVSATVAYATALTAVAPTTAELLAYAPAADNGGATFYTYDSANRVKTMAVAQGGPAGAVRWAVTSNSYDSAGNLLFTTRHATAQTTAGTQTFPTAAPVIDPLNDRTTHYRYDGANRLRVSIDATGAITRVDYDSRGNAIRRVAYAKPTALPAIVTAAYNPATTSVDRVSEALFDRDNREIYSIDALGQVTERRYDAFDNLTATLQYATPLTAAQRATANALGGDGMKNLLSPKAGVDRLTRYTYNSQGQLRYTVDAGGYLKETVYNALGQVAETRDYLAQPPGTWADPLDAAVLATEANRQIAAKSVAVNSYTYDAKGNLLSTMDALQKTETYGYDALGRKTSFTNKAGNTWTYVYDAAGHVVRETGPQVYVYATDFSAAIDSWGAGVAQTLVTVMQYDMLGNLIKRIEADGTSQARATQYGYDLAGRQTSTTLPSVRIYDATDPISGQSAAATEKDSGERVNTVAYNTFGDAVYNRDAAGNISYKVYDLRGQVRYDVDAMAYVTGYERNAFGDVTALTRYNTQAAIGSTTPDKQGAAAFKAAVRPDAANDRTINSAYDALGRLVKSVEPATSVFDQHATASSPYLLAGKATETVYNRFGEVRAQLVYGASALAVAADGVVTGGARLTEAAETRNAYDLRGNRASQLTVRTSAADGRTGTGYVTAYTYEWDGVNRVVTQIEFSTPVDWNDAGAYDGATLPSASALDRVTSSAYNLAGLLVLQRKINVGFVSNGQQTTGNIDTSYGYDVLGNQVRVSDALGGNSFTYYDKLGRAIAVAKSQTPTAGIAAAASQLTEFKLDLLGNIVIRVDYAQGAAGTPTEAAPPKPLSATHADNRVTLTRYNLDGRAVEVLDAEQFSKGAADARSRTSYDIVGHAVKQWRVVTSGGLPQVAFQIARYDALGRVIEVETPANVDLVNNTARGNTRKGSQYNAFGEVVATTLAGADAPLTMTKYDQAGHAWFSNAGGVDTVTLFDARGNVASTVVSTAAAAFPRDLPTAGAMLDAIKQTGIHRTDYRYDLMGQQVDMRQGDATQQYVLVRGAGTGIWTKVLRDQADPRLDSVLVIADAAEKTMSVSISYRLLGSGVWIDGASRVRVVGDYRGFLTAGLAAGSYEYRVTMTPPGEPAFVRADGRLDIVNTPSTVKNTQLARVYAMLLNRVPDLIGLNHYVDLANKGETVAHLVLAFLGSTEAAVYLGGDAEAVIKRLLNNGFGRDGASAEADPTYASDVARWAAAYDSAKRAGGDAPGQMIVDMIDALMLPAPAPLSLAAQAAIAKAQARMNNSVTAGLAYAMEHRGNDQESAQRIHRESATDLALALQDAKASGVLEANRVKTTQAYLALFGRAPEKAGMDSWTKALQTILPAQMIGGMLASQEARHPLLYPTLGIDDASYDRALIARVHLNVRGVAATEADMRQWSALMPSATDSADVKTAKRAAFVLRMIDEVANSQSQDVALMAQKQLFNTRTTLGLSYAKLDLATIPAADQEGMNRAMFAAVTSAVTSGASAQAAADKTVAGVAAAATAARALSAAASAAAGATGLEEVRARIARLYVALLDRTPDTVGLDFLVGVLQAGNATSAAWITLANNMIISDESRKDSTLTAVPALENDKFVERVYTLALGEKPVSAGALQEMDAFTRQLAGGASRGEVALSIVDTLLTYKDLTPRDAELKARFNNKVGVALASVVNLGAFDWGSPNYTGAIAPARAVLQRVTATDIQVALDYAYEVARTAHLNNSQPTLDAAAQAKLNVDKKTAAALASMQAASGVAAATTAAQAQPTAAVRLQLMQMYVGLLGRTVETYTTRADLEGLEFLVEQSKTFSMAALAQGFLDSDEGKPLYAGIADPAVFVAKVYNTILPGLALTQTELAYWAGKLGGANPMTRGQVAFDILTSVQNYASATPGAAENDLLARRQAFFQRVADSFAVVNKAEQAVVSQYNAAKQAQDTLGKSLAALLATRDRDEAVRAGAVQSAQSALDGAGANPKLRLQLTLLYATLLGRTEAPKQSELDFYITGNGAATIERITQAFIDSEEARNKGGFPAGNRDFVIKLYDKIMGRVPLSTEVDFWAGRMTGAANERGAIALQMLTSYMNYSDAKIDQLERKAVFDAKIATFIQQELAEAKGIASAAYDDWQTKDGGRAAAFDTYNRAYLAANDAATAVKGIEGSSDYQSALLFQQFLPAGNQRYITAIYLGIRGPTASNAVDFNGLAFQMQGYSRYASQDEYRKALIAALINESDTKLSKDLRTFIGQMYVNAINRPARADEVEFWATKNMTREQIAYQILGAQESVDNLRSKIDARVIFDQQTATARIQAYKDATAAKTRADTAQSNAGIAYENARIPAEAARLVKVDTQTRADYSGALQTAFAKTPTADSAAVTAARSRDAYQPVYDAFQKQIKPLAELEKIAQGDKADQAGAALALALADRAKADAGAAGAYVAEMGGPVVARQSREVAQLYVTLLGRAPQLAELRLWNGKLGQGTTLTQIAASLLQGTAGATLYPPGMSNDAFVTQLFKTALNRGFDRDPGGLRFWSDRLAGAAPLSRAELAARFAGSIPDNRNDDTLVFNATVAQALQKVVGDGTQTAIAASMAQAILTAEEAARSAAGAYNAGALATAAKTPSAQYMQPLARLYLALLNRAPDAPGLQVWVDAMNRVLAPLTAGQVADSMLGAPESQARYQGTTDSAFLGQVFANAFGYAAPDGVLTPYLAQMTAANRGAVALAMINAIADGPAGNNLKQAATRDAFNAKVGVTLVNVANTLADQARLLDEASTMARALAASRPVEQRVESVSLTLSGTVRDGTNAVLDAITRDRWGNVLSVADARNPNWKISYRYNYNNQQIAQTANALADATGVPTGAAGYDALGRQAIVTDLNGNSTRLGYDANGNLAVETHADGGKVDYTYNVFGDRTSVTQSLGNTSYASSQKIVTTYTYDHLGRQKTRSSADVTAYYAAEFHAKGADEDMSVQTSVGPVKMVDSYDYDELGRRVATTQSSATSYRPVNGVAIVDLNSTTVTRVRYDLGGNIITTTDAMGYQTLTAYNALNYKVASLDAQGGAMAWQVDTFGRVIGHDDLVKRHTTYTYDAAGQLSTQTSTGPAGAPGGQNISYRYADARLIEIHDKVLGQLTTYTYDAAGNRVTERVVLTGTNRALQDNTISYDRQGRVSEISSAVSAIGADYRVKYAYDNNGNRRNVTTTYTNALGGLRTITVNNTFDGMNRQLTVGGSVVTTYANNEDIAAQEAAEQSGNPNGITYSSYHVGDGAVERHTITYDGAGNRVRDEYGARVDSYRYDAAGRLETVTDQGGKVTVKRKYDGASRIIESFDNGEFRVNAYDANGRMLRQRAAKANGDYLNDIFYLADIKGNVSGYDKLGNLMQYQVLVGTDPANAKRYVNTYGDQGKFDSYQVTSTVASARGATTVTVNKIYDVNGNLAATDGKDARTLLSDSAGRILEKTQKGLVTYTLIANDEVIGSSNEDMETFSSGFDAIGSPTLLASPSVYIVRGTNETLQSIAKAVWGDSRLWYLIADANGGLESADLLPGQPLNLPARVNTVLNSYETFKPYNAADAVGDTTPELVMPSQGGGGCGGIGTLIMVVVAVAVTVITGGAMAAALGPVLSGALGAAAGSIASQAVGMAIGAQDGFSWKSVALSAISGGVAAGLPANIGGFSNVYVAAAADAMVANVVTQGVSIAAGLQNGFEWRNVAASAAGAVAGQATSGSTIFGSSKFAQRSISAFAAGTAASIMRGGKIEVVRIATDAFGNALGRSLAGMINGSDAATKINANQMRAGAEDAAADRWAFENSQRQTNEMGATYADITIEGSGPVEMYAAQVAIPATGNPATPPIETWPVLDSGGEVLPRRGGPNFPAGMVDGTPDKIWYTPSGGGVPMTAFTLDGRNFTMPDGYADYSGYSVAPISADIGTPAFPNDYLIPTSFDDVKDILLGNKGGQSALSLWDTQQRMDYHSANTAAKNSALDLILQADLEGTPSKGTDAAYRASEQRIINRGAARIDLSYGGRLLSEAVDQSHGPAWYFDKYSKSMPNASELDIATRVAVGAASSNKWVNRLGTASKVLGPLGVGFGAYSTTTNIMNAPAASRNYVVAREAGTWAGGWYGASFGTAAGVGLAAFALGSNPVGWAIGATLALGFVGGVGGGIAGSHLGGYAAGNAYKGAAQWFTK